MALKSTIAGAWYPGTERDIRALADKWERRIAAEATAGPGAAAAYPSKPNVLLLPHAGWAYSGEIAWRAVRLARDAGFSRVVVLAPSHRAWIENRLVAPEADAISTPLGEIAIDRDWLDRLALVAPVARSDKVHLAEHSAQIEYPLLQLALGKGFTLVPLVMGSFGADQMAMCARALQRLMDDRTLLVISSDFTHYGDDFSYAPYGTAGGEDVRAKVAEIDGEAFERIADGDDKRAQQPAFVRVEDHPRRILHNIFDIDIRVVSPIRRVCHIHRHVEVPISGDRHFLRSCSLSVGRHQPRLREFVVAGQPGIAGDSFEFQFRGTMTA